ncbi:MAG: hypothetical protein ACE5I1_06595 [bacterium]
MIKLKSRKNIIKNAVPTQRIDSLRIPVSDLSVRIYKFPHIAFNQPSHHQVEAVQLNTGKLKLKYWTRRFFTLIVPTLSQQSLFKFSYQLKKYGIDISYKLVWQIFRTAVAYPITLNKIKTHIRRKIVRRKDILYHEYEVNLQDRNAAHTIGTPHVESVFSEMKYTAPVKELAFGFPIPKSDSGIDTQPESPEFSGNQLAKPGIHTLKINTISIPPLQMGNISIHSELDIKTSIFGESIQEVASPAIQPIDINSLFIYASSGKNLFHDKPEAKATASETEAIDMVE